MNESPNAKVGRLIGSAVGWFVKGFLFGVGLIAAGATSGLV